MYSFLFRSKRWFIKNVCDLFFTFLTFLFKYSATQCYAVQVYKGYHYGTCVQTKLKWFSTVLLLWKVFVNLNLPTLLAVHYRMMVVWWSCQRWYFQPKIFLMIPKYFIFSSCHNRLVSTFQLMIFHFLRGIMITSEAAVKLEWTMFLLLSLSRKCFCYQNGVSGHSSSKHHR